MRAPRTVSFVAQKKLDSPMVNKRKADAATKKDNAKKEAGAPKRPPSAFIIFMEDFRKTYKENFPENKSAANVTKAGGKKWKSMIESEKATYVATAAQRKIEYMKLKEELNMKQTDDDKHIITPDESSISTTSEITNETEQEELHSFNKLTRVDKEENNVLSHKQNKSYFDAITSTVMSTRGTHNSLITKFMFRARKAIRIFTERVNFETCKLGLKRSPPPTLKNENH
ncbi:high mobility group B protein 3-like [Impatiens glandulifera]|uniref:high mobility group B protein 3-like n=1 Tax=Impatiens glandulifera TaxID=253017 RepID=UPI001FB0EF35|nr:high mobility group B protein 3-like [Impatiens glandulifera]